MTLWEAVEADDVESVRRMLDAGVDPEARGEDGASLLACAVGANSLAVAALLEERGCRLDPERDDQGWLLPHVARDGRPEAVQWLLARGVPVDVTDFRGCSALTYAAVKNRLDIVELLLAHGANPNLRDNDSETVLMWACDGPGRADVVRRLLAAGADPDLETDVGGTALGWAAGYGDAEIVRVLLEAGARPHGARTLMAAAQRGQVEMVRLLLEYGADPQPSALGGEAPVELARRGGHREVVKLLRAAVKARSGDLPSVPTT